MKPRYRPGKIGTKGRQAREVIAKATRVLTSLQMQQIQGEKNTSAMSSKAGKKGRRAKWRIDYEKGGGYGKKSMPWREPESFTVDGIRRWPKRNA